MGLTAMMTMGEPARVCRVGLGWCINLAASTIFITLRYLEKRPATTIAKGKYDENAESRTLVAYRR
jgi:hypothetical protein